MSHDGAVLDAIALPLALVGRSPAVARLRAEIEAARDAGCVLIEAEPGLDAEDIARDVHARRSSGPFMAVDCAGAEPPVVEASLFGARVRTDHDLECVDAGSAIARADGGTLYLANLTDLSAAAQARLARVVRDREVVIGGTAAPGTVAPLDLAVVGSIAGSDADSDAARLRRDLGRHFDRARIAVPPLRQRTEDIPLLVDQLLAAMCRAEGVPPPPVTHPAMTLLAAMPWKGNLVELRRAVSRLGANAAGGVIQLEDVLTHVRFDVSATAPAPAGTLRDARQQFEREYIALVIRHHRGHIGDAARALGIQRTNLYRKARQLGIAVARSGR
jgi:two-component system nitrogen regulation response regulator NtrX